MASLTPRQRQVLDFIERFADDNGFPPSLEEIAAGLGFSSVSNAHQHVTALVERGHLLRPKGKNRSLEIVRQESGRELPLLGTVAAGAPIETAEPPEPFTTGTELMQRGDFVVRWRGDGLLAEQIRDGDYLVVRAETPVEEGALLLAVLEGRAVVRRAARNAQGLLHLTAAPGDVQVPLLDEVSVRGIIEGVIRLV